MHDSAALTWREVLEKHYSALADELAIRLDAEIEKRCPGGDCNRTFGG